MRHTPTFIDLLPVLGDIAVNLDDPVDYANLTATCSAFYVARSISHWAPIIFRCYGEDVLFLYDVFPDPVPVADVPPLPRPWLTEKAEQLMCILFNYPATNKTIKTDSRNGRMVFDDYGPDSDCVPFRVPDREPYQCTCYSPHYTLSRGDTLGNAIHHSPSYVNFALCNRWLKALELFVREGVVNVDHHFTMCVGFGMLDVAEYIVSTMGVDPDWKRYIVAAVESGNVDAVEYVLVKAGRIEGYDIPFPRYPNSWDRARWPRSYSLSNPKILERLLNAGWRCEPDGPALYAAFHMGEWDSIAMLLAHGTKVTSSFLTNWKYERMRDPAVVGFLITLIEKHGIEPALCVEIFFYNACQWNPSLAQFLLEFVPDGWKPERDSYYTVLHNAVRAASVPLMKRLFERKLCVDGVEWDELFQYASEIEDECVALQATKYLVEYGAPASIEAFRTQMRPWAIAQLHASVVIYLLELGCSTPDIPRETCLTFMSQYRFFAPTCSIASKPEIMVLLLQRGCTIYSEMLPHILNPDCARAIFRNADKSFMTPAMATKLLEEYGQQSFVMELLPDLLDLGADLRSIDASKGAVSYQLVSKVVRCGDMKLINRFFADWRFDEEEYNHWVSTCIQLVCLDEKKPSNRHSQKIDIEVLRIIVACGARTGCRMDKYVLDALLPPLNEPRVYGSDNWEELYKRPIGDHRKRFNPLDAQVARLVLENGAVGHLTGDLGLEMLHRAVYKRHAELVEVFLEYLPLDVVCQPAVASTPSFRVGASVDGQGMRTSIFGTPAAPSVSFDIVGFGNASASSWYQNLPASLRTENFYTTLLKQVLETHCDPRIITALVKHGAGRCLLKNITKEKLMEKRTVCDRRKEVWRVREVMGVIEGLLENRDTVG